MERIEKQRKEVYRCTGFVISDCVFGEDNQSKATNPKIWDEYRLVERKLTKKYRVEIVVQESVHVQEVKYGVEAWLEGEASRDALNLFFRICKDFNVSLDPSYKMAWTDKKKERTSAVRFAIKLAEALSEAGFTTEGALIRKDLRGKLEDALERKPQIEKLPGLSLSKKASMEIPKDFLKILKEKAMEPV